MTTNYLTVAIPYVNAEPHLGYAYELVLADIHARACRLDGVDVRFVGGTDDFSLKNVLAAEAAGVSVRGFVDQHALAFEQLRGPLALSFDDFLRTSADARHVPAVQRLWNAALANGDLDKRSYVGDYCVGCERFYKSDELHDGRCPEHLAPVEHVAEENWFFRLSDYQDRLVELIDSDTIRISPPPFRTEVLAFLRSGLDDISVSRTNERARGWGVAVPNDPSQVISVWFDALTNYISALDYGRRPDGAPYHSWWQCADARTHVIGKGILRFHAVYWPAFLLAAGEPLPTHIRVHPYLTVDRRKLSKSTGARVDPTHVAATYGTDALRWWFCRDVGETADTDFTVERLVARANEDLAGGVGNVVSRVVSLIHRHREGQPPRDAPPLDAVARLPERTRGLLRGFDLRLAAAEIVAAVDALNVHLEATAPWALARDPDATGALEAVLATQLATARVIADALAPICPALSGRAQRQLSGDPTLPPLERLIGRLEAAGERSA